MYSCRRSSLVMVLVLGLVLPGVYRPVRAAEPDEPSGAAATPAAEPQTTESDAGEPDAEPQPSEPAPASDASTTTESTAAPVTARRTRRGYSLARCLELASLNFPRIAEARSKAAYYRAQLDEARTAPFSQWVFTGGIGVAPTVRGGPVFSPNTDVSLSSNMGLAWNVKVEGFVPLWTFGKITNLVDAAENQTKLGTHQVQKERNQVKLDVRKAYFGLQLARTSQSLLKDALKVLDEMTAKLERQVEEGEGDEIDLLKLRSYRAELEGRAAEARKYETIAVAGLRFLTGISGPFDIDTDQLQVGTHQLRPVSHYLQAARLFRPDINMARAGVQARRAQVALARSRLYPDVGVGMTAGWMRAPELADQINPYVRDDANYLRYGFAVATRWNLDFLPAYARLQQAEAQLEETRAIEQFALGGVGLEVQTAYAEVQEALVKEQAFAKAELYAKQWLIAVQQGIDIGTQESKDLVDPARQYATQRFAHLSAIMDLNVALSKLAQVTGWDAVAPGSR